MDPPVGFSSAPTLTYKANEIAIVSASSVGLYFFNDKSPDWNHCKAILTSDRIILQKESSTGIIFCSLQQILKLEYAKGYLMSSPKVSLVLGVPVASPSNAAATKTSSTSWTCSLCGLENVLSMDRRDIAEKCVQCGCKAPEHVLQALGQIIARAETPDFHVRVKLAFRKGGSACFYEKLKYALERRRVGDPGSLAGGLVVPNGSPMQRSHTPASFTSETSSVGGLSNIITRLETSQKTTSAQLSTAFEDLDSLIDKAAEMVVIAERLSKQLLKAEGCQDTNVLKDIYLSIGLSNPITKEITSIDSFYMELAGELSSLVSRLFVDSMASSSHFVHFIPLSDIYCFWNRARGSALVSPADVHQAARLLEGIKSPYCLETFSSGLSAVCKQEFRSSALLDQLAALFGGCNKRHDFYKDMNDLVELMHVPYSILKEIMTLALAKGLVCKDETIASTKFYPNMIT